MRPSGRATGDGLQAACGRQPSVDVNVDRHERKVVRRSPRTAGGAVDRHERKCGSEPSAMADGQ
jgi:hypothetical protein